MYGYFVSPVTARILLPVTIEKRYVKHIHARTQPATVHGLCNTICMYLGDARCPKIEIFCYSQTIARDAYFPNNEFVRKSELGIRLLLSEFQLRFLGL